MCYAAAYPTAHLYYDLFLCVFQPIKTPKSLNKSGDILNIFIFSLSIITWQDREEIVFLLATLQILLDKSPPLKNHSSKLFFSADISNSIIRKRKGTVVPKYKKPLSVMVLCLTVFFMEGPRVCACSLWAVTGDRSKDKGTLVAQTWDVPHGTSGELRLVIPAKGFRYLGLFPMQEKTGGNAVAGINEHGLATVKATADTIAPKKKLKGSGGVVEAILTSCVSVDAVLANRNLLARSQPAFLIVADHSKIALIQIGSGGHLAVEVTGNGLFYQTNHYTNQNLLRENEQYIESSQLRLNRLQHLLVNHPDPFTLDDFLSLAGDKGNGPDNSIWRIGGPPKKERTLASLVAFLPRNSPPELYFRLLNPGSNELYYELKLDRPFWTEGTE
jgi:hypothetical protein